MLVPTAEEPRFALREILIRQTDRACEYLAAHGSMQPGSNGAYGDPETPIRNTSHWLVSFCNAYKATEERKYRAAAEKALAYLLEGSSQFRGSIICRLSARKDTSNGVLGQAHVIEALWRAWQVLGSEPARDLAIAIAERHPFDHINHCWHRLTATGKVISPDFTFNHQLYYAAVLVPLAANSASVASGLQAFLGGLTHTFRVHESGLIRHNIVNRNDRIRQLRELATQLRPASASKMRAKEINYHTYNVFAFTLLLQNGGALPSSVQERWRKVIQFLNTPDIQRRLQRENWGNPLASGTETLCADVAFYKVHAGESDADDMIDRAREFLIFHSGPGADYRLFSMDPPTQAARVYRYWRLL